MQALLAEAARVDAEEDGHGKGKRGDELPKELGRRESRLKDSGGEAALEQEAREAAEKKQAEVAAQLKERRSRRANGDGSLEGGRRRRRTRKRRSRSRKRNDTDPESRIMKDGARRVCPSL